MKGAMMFKLIKYEFRKQLFSKFIMLGALGLIELFFLYTLYFTENSEYNGISLPDKIIFPIVLFIIAGFAILAVLGFECVTTFHKDLKTKQSYMLFLIPKSIYTIIGAKIITAALQIHIAGAVIIALIATDVSLVLAKFGQLKDLINILKEVMAMFTDMSTDIAATLIMLAIYGVVVWFAFICVALLSITFTYTLLENVKLKGVISVIVFLAINYAFTKITGLLMPAFADMTVTALAALSAASFAEAIAAYFVSAWMLDKKISV
jgi:hypothetical protein